MGDDTFHSPAGLSLCKTSKSSFALLFTIPNDDLIGETICYEQSIKFIEFTRFDKNLRYIQSEV